MRPSQIHTGTGPSGAVHLFGVTRDDELRGTASLDLSCAAVWKGYGKSAFRQPSSSSKVKIKFQSPSCKLWLTMSDSCLLRLWPLGSTVCYYARRHTVHFWECSVNRKEPVMRIRGGRSGVPAGRA